jgi:hypothetical protein
VGKAMKFLTGETVSRAGSVGKTIEEEIVVAS